MKKIATVLMLGASLAICGCKGEGTTETSAETEQVAAQDTATQGDNTEMQANTPEASQTDAAAAAAETVQKEEAPAEVIDTNSVEANMPEIEKTIKALLDGGSLSKYCTKACIKKMKKAALDEFGGDEEAAGEPSVIDLFPCDYTDGFGGSKMIKSIKAEKGNAVVVSYKVFDKTFKTKLYMVNEGGIWKVNNYK